MGEDNRGHELGTGAPHLLLRQVACTRGRGRDRRRVRPPPRVRTGASRCSTRSTAASPRPVAPTSWSCRAPVPIVGRALVGRRPVHAMRRANTSASRCTTTRAPTRDRPGCGARTRSRPGWTTRSSAWQSWSELHQAYVGPWHDLVHHSGRVLQALSFQPTGAICAAADHVAARGRRRRPQLGLPLRLGARRVVHHRGAVGGGVPRRGQRVLRLHDHVGGRLARRRRRPADHVRHRRRARPHRARAAPPRRVAGSPRRCGSATARGASASSTCTASCSSAVHRLSDQSSTRRRARARHPRGSSSTLADTAAARWHEKDQGIWEVRGEPRHFVYSKLMCWVALDRAIALADRLDADDRVDEWKRTRDEIADAILSEGWSDRVGAFTQSFGSDELDASNLMMPLVGFLPADDPRVLATIDATEERLTDERGLVYRYRGCRRARGRGRHLPAVHVLARAGPGDGRSDRARPAACSSARPSSSTTSACSPKRSTRHRRAPRQLPAGVQPHRSRQRGVGHLRGRGVDGVRLSWPTGIATADHSIAGLLDPHVGGYPRATPVAGEVARVPGAHHGPAPASTESNVARLRSTRPVSPARNILNPPLASDAARHVR